MPSNQQLAKIQARLEAIPKAVRDDVKPSLQQSGADLVAAISAAAPKETGKLAASIAVAPKAGQDAAVAVTAGNADAPYARFVEFGTVDAPAHPFFWPAYRAAKDRIKDNIKNAISGAVNKGFAS
jgi:HK97 gp10 family phage protein